MFKYCLFIIFAKLSERFNIIDDFLSTMVRIRVGGILKNEDKYLIVRQQPSHQKQFYCFPGGEVERDESLEQALQRELREEINILVASSKLVGLGELMLPSSHSVDFFYAIHSFTFGNPADYKKVQHKGCVKEILWLPLNDIDSLDFRPKEALQLVLPNSHFIYLGVYKS